MVRAVSVAGLLGPALCLALIGLAAPAAAADIENVRTLEIGVQGSVAQRCAMGSIGNMDFGDLNRPGLGSVTRVSLDCNIPFNMTVRAQNGGLAHAQMPAGQGPYAGTLPYSIGIAMPIRRPRVSIIERNFASSELRGAGRTLSSEGGIAVDGMALTVALGRPSGEAGLLAGNYSETIEITITPI